MFATFFGGFCRRRKSFLRRRARTLGKPSVPGVRPRPPRAEDSRDAGSPGRARGAAGADHSKREIRAALSKTAGVSDILDGCLGPAADGCPTRTGPRVVGPGSRARL